MIFVLKSKSKKINNIINCKNYLNWYNINQKDKTKF